jgi:hypothetical protein
VTQTNICDLSEKKQQSLRRERVKKFWLVLLSLELVMVITTSAFAVDVKFSGSFYAAGTYLDKTTVKKETSTNGPSTAFYFQRLRLTTEFIASPGLSVITTANIMKREWGAARSAPGTTLDTVGTYTTSAATRSENENIGFDYTYLNYASQIGLFKAGYMPDYTWGTAFHDNDTPAGKLSYMLPVGNWKLGIQVVKIVDNSFSANLTTAKQADHDTDKVQTFFIYSAKNFDGGMIYIYANDAANRNPAPATSLKSSFHSIQPYLRAKAGPVYIQAELDYYFGDIAKFDTLPVGFSDQKLNSLAGWIDAVATLGSFYVGGTFAYAQGNGADITTVNAYSSGGKDWSPTLIMWNSDRNYWLGNITGHSNSTATGTANFGTVMTNAFFYQVRAGVRPIDKLDICAAVAFAQADTLNGLGTTQSALGGLIGLSSQAGYISKDYGYEIDVTGTYKIADNLTYMLGFGYLITGDYFKGSDSTAQISNDYIITNKLTLTF